MCRMIEYKRGAFAERVRPVLDASVSVGYLQC